MKVKLILSFLVLFGTIGCLNLNYFTGGGSTQSQDSTTIFSKGKTYVKLEEMRSTKGTSKTFFDHPGYLRSDVLSSAMSSIYFKERGIKGWGREQNVFQESELFNLVPHIVDAFSKASPSQYVLVSSNYAKGKRRFLRSEMYTIFAMFIGNDKLNVRFSRVQYIPLTETGESSIFTNPEEVFADPFSIKKNPSWKLIPRTDQRFKEGYSNWLVVDLEESAFVKKGQEKEIALNNNSGVPGVQGKQEGAKVSATEGTVSGSPKRVEAKPSIKDQLLELKELETTGLITREDYERRKAEILVGKQEKSIREKFIELRKLKEGGFIGNIDYEHKKRDLLEEDDESERERNIKDVLAEYLELRDEGFITDKDYDYKKKKLLREF
jgi:hypothetical protein